MQLSDAEKDRRMRKAWGVDRIMGPEYIGEDENSNPFRDVLRFHGITDEFIARKLREELDATQVTAFKGTREATNVKTGVVVKRTKIYYSKKLVAWDIRQKARIDAQKLLDLYPAEKAPVGGSGIFGELSGPLRVLLESIIGKQIEHRPAIDAEVVTIPQKIPVRILSFMESRQCS